MTFCRSCGLARRASLDRRGHVGRVLRDVRGDVEVAQVIDEPAHMVSLVSAEREAARSANGGRSSLGRLAFMPFWSRAPPRPPVRDGDALTSSPLMAT